MGMPEVWVVTAGQILHELDGASVLSSKGSTDSVASGFIEMNVHHCKTSSILSQVLLENLDAIGAAPLASPPEREQPRAEGLLDDPRSWSSTMSTAQDSINNDRKSEVATNAFMFSLTSSLTTRCGTCSKLIFSPSQPRH